MRFLGNVTLYRHRLLDDDGRSLRETQCRRLQVYRLIGNRFHDADWDRLQSSVPREADTVVVSISSSRLTLPERASLIGLLDSFSARASELVLCAPAPLDLPTRLKPLAGRIVPAALMHWLSEAPREESFWPRGQC